MRPLSQLFFPLLAAAAALFLCSCASAVSPSPLPSIQPSLRIYTCQDASIYSPLVKEYQERTNLRVSVEAGTFQELEANLTNHRFLQEYDLILGADAATLTHYQRLWLPYQSSESRWLLPGFSDPQSRWTPLCALPAVILYNTRIVTWRELPEDWSCLLEPRWKGRIAFVSPAVNASYAAALLSVCSSDSQQQACLSRFQENLDGLLLSGVQEAEDGVSNGRFSLGVSLEGNAELLRLTHPDIDYIYPQSGFFLVPNGTAIVRGCSNPELAKEFLDFTVSKDAQQILASSLNCRPVRQDVSPFPGLPPLSQLPQAGVQLEEFYQRRTQLLQHWQQAPAVEKGGLP